MTSLEDEPVEGPPILDRHGCLRAECREQVDVRGGELPFATVEDGESAVDLSGLARERNGHHGFQPLGAHLRHDREREGHRRIIFEEAGRDGPPLGDGDPRRTSAERHLEARDQLVADRAGATHRDEHAFLLVEPKEDRAIGTGHIQRLRHDRLRDLREVEASHERLARPMEDVEVPLPRACLAIEPHLLTQEPDEDDADADRSREARQVPRNAVPKGADQNPDQPQHPDIRGEEQVTGERITRGVSA